MLFQLFRNVLFCNLFSIHLERATVIFFLVVVVVAPLFKLIDDFRVSLLLNPSLEVPNDVLVIKAAQVGDLSEDSSFLLRVELVCQLDFLDGVNVTVKSMASFVNDTEATAANLL